MFNSSKLPVRKSSSKHGLRVIGQSFKARSLIAGIQAGTSSSHLRFRKTGRGFDQAIGDQPSPSRSVGGLLSAISSRHHQAYGFLEAALSVIASGMECNL